MSTLPANALPVLIVGAGPTGLAAALSLSGAGVAVRLVDRAAVPSDKSRAIGIQARTLELFEQHRIVEQFLALGHRSHAVHVYAGERTLVSLDFDPLQSRYPYLLFLDQNVTERLLCEALARRGIAIERGVELTDFASAEIGVDVALRHADGRIEPLRASYLIGADGAHSTVRHRLGLGFQGAAWSQMFLLADLYVDWHLSDNAVHIFTSSAGLAAVFPLGGGRYRLIANQRDISEMPDQAPSLELCHAVLAARAQHAVRLTQLGWSAYFRVDSRMVEGLRAGRVFVVGDAAHVHSPAGAQGMNTGIQEAFNLGWKLARVLRGGAPERLLDTYHAERHPIERGVLRQTSFLTRAVGAEHAVMRGLRDHLVPLLTSLGPVRDAARRTVSELALGYRRSPLTLERQLDGGPHAGERMPDAVIHVLDGPLGTLPGAARLFELHDPACFSLFILLDPHAAAAQGAALLETRLAALLGDALRCWRISDVGNGMRDPGPQALAHTYGRTRPAFYLVRPDGYIAARGRPGDPVQVAALARHCATWFVPAQRDPAGTVNASGAP